MKLYNKFVSIVLVLSILVISAAPICSAAEVKGRCGSDCTYTLSDDGLLYISGTGTITKIFNEDEQINKKISKIIIEDGIQKIGEKSFANLMYQKMDITLPDSLLEIGKDAFNFSWTSDIQFPKNLKIIGDNAFEDNYLEHVVLPDSLEELGIFAFAGGKYIKEVRFPAYMTTIPAVSFSGCLELKIIEWPQSLKKIDERAFENCNFKSFKIPDTVESVGNSAFYNCSQLKTITVGCQCRRYRRILLWAAFP